MSDSEEPKPCPFCGDVPPVSKADGMTPMVGHACRVLDLQITVPLHVWNTRAERTCTMVRQDAIFSGVGLKMEYFICSECQCVTTAHKGNQPSFCSYCGAKVVG